MKPWLQATLLLAAAGAPWLREAPVALPTEAALEALVHPQQIEGRSVQLSAARPWEAEAFANFPGAISRCSDGERLWILRAVAAPTLALHSSWRCFEAAGWRVRALDAQVDASGGTWSRFQAQLGAVQLVVRESVRSADGKRSWPDVDQWRWDAWWGDLAGPWLALSAVEAALPTER